MGALEAVFNSGNRIMRSLASMLASCLDGEAVRRIVTTTHGYLQL